MLHQHPLSRPSSASAVPQELQPGRWTVVPPDATVGFAIRELGLLNVRGRFHDFRIEVERPTGDSLPHVSAEIAVEAIDTGNLRRDEHLRSPSFLDAAAFPTITFRSLAWDGAPPHRTLLGELTIRGQALPVELAVEFEEHENGTLAFAARGESDRRACGVGTRVPALVIARRVTLAVEGLARPEHQATT